MSKHSQLVLKMACCALVALLGLQIVSVVRRLKPLDRLVIPELPHLPVSLDTSVTNKGTNLPALSTAGKKGTNSSPGAVSGNAGTNSAPNELSKGASTNQVPAPASAQPATNLVANKLPTGSDTNVIPLEPAAKAGTNLAAGQMSKGSETNGIPGQASAKKGTNTIPDQASAKKGTNLNARPGPIAASPTKLPEIPPLIQARVDRVYQSEILGNVTRPMPMGLLGIAGNFAFLRAANGQTGMVKVGDELGGLKLLSIGTNRVLVEHEGQTKELSIFSGFGSETLLPKQKETPNETVPKPR